MSMYSKLSSVVPLLLLVCVANSFNVVAQSIAPRANNSDRIDFSWRAKMGDFPQDKPGYLILTTEDALTYSKVLPEFVKQKEAMGFYVYVATEQDYGTGKTGNAQAAQVRVWMREFNKRAGLKYALLIGNSSSRSSDLPSPTIPDGERGGMEEAYADLDGAWVDLYLNTTEKDTRSSWEQMCAGSILKTKYLRQGGGRKDDVIMSRIAYVGNEIGNGAYDLDRILEKTIRYERDTIAGKNLDWRGHALSIITNYGGTNWDDPFIKSVETAGGSFEWHSQLGISGPYVPENTFDGRAANAELMHQNRRRGLLCTMSHGYSRGGEGIMSRDGVFANMDDRWPSAIGVAACTAFALADNGNTGQTWLRKGGIFACGTGWSGNNNSRVPMQRNLIEKRVSVGEAVRNAVVTYGDPSLHVLPPEGTPLRALLVTPAFNAHYEERTLASDVAFKPVTETYTLKNQSKEEMQVTVECDAGWVALSAKKLTLKPDETAKVEVASNDRAQKLAPGTHVANLRFLRDDGQRDERRFAVNLQPVKLTSAYTFDEVFQGNRFPDVFSAPKPKAHEDHASLWLLAVNFGPHWNPFVKLGDKVPGVAPEPQGKVGGALRLDSPKAPFRRRLAGFSQWRGASASLWFKVDAIPAAKKSTTILSAPFSLTLDDKGTLLFAQGGSKAAPLSVIQPGEWNYILLRSDIDGGKVRATLNFQREVIAEASRPPAAMLTLGSFAGAVDEIRTWSGELSDAAARSELAVAAKPFVAPAPAPNATYADDGVLRAPKGMPVAFDITDASKSLDVTKLLADAGLDFAGLREAPEWLEYKNGVLALKPGTDFDRIDFGGYDFFLVLKSKDGRVCEHSLKARIPVPEVRIRITRAADNTLSIVSVGGEKKPLAKGVIRYTTDGSPVNVNSPIYSQPFKTDGNKVTARFFYLGEYPYASVTLDSEFGIPREKWKALAVSGSGGTLAKAPTAFDGRSDTAWKNAGGVLPQFFAWELGAATSITAFSVHSTIKDADGRLNGFVLYASDDGKSWRKIKEGELESSPNALRIKLDAPHTARYLKLEATSLHVGKDLVITELEVYSR